MTVFDMDFALTVHYVSAPPGTRKTTAAINYMAKHIKRGYAGQDVGYMFYVAPTRMLLQQTVKNLKQKVPPDVADLMIHAIYSESLASGLTVEQEIYNVLDGNASDKTRTAVPFAEGSVLFITHAGFLQLRKHEKFANTIVIFDESRKWVDMVERIEMRDGAEELFHKLFETQGYSNTSDSDKAEFLMVMPRQIPSNQLASLIENLGSAKAFRQLEHMYSQLVPKKDSTVRMRVFGSLVGKGETRSMIRITLPSHPFRDFRSVLILSADFESSQMFHLLKLEGCYLRDITATFMNRYTKEGYGKSLQQIEDRYSKLVIVPLLDSQEMPSKYQAAAGVILPRDNILSMKNRMAKLKVNTHVLRQVVKNKRDPTRHKFILNAAQTKLLRSLTEFGCETDSLQWMLDASHRLAAAWWKKNPPKRNPQDEDRPYSGVMIMNHSEADRVINRKYYQSLSLGEVEGRNEFQQSNLIAFLAAVNPHPVIERLLKIVLASTNYDPAEDFVVDKAIQSLGRGNIRNHASKDMMLAIVPTCGLADRIAARMHNQPRVDRSVMLKLGGYTYWSYKTAVAKENGDLNTDERQALLRQIQVLRVKRSVWRGKLKNAETQERAASVEAKLHEIETQLDHLLAQRDS